MRMIKLVVMIAMGLAIGAGLGFALRQARSATPKPAAATEKSSIPSVRGVQLSALLNSADFDRYRRLGANTLIFESADPQISAAKKQGFQVFFIPRMSKVTASEVIAQAKWAAANQADLFGIGYGLSDTGPDEEAWTKLLADVRKAYSGKLAVVADLTNYPYVSWWDLADVLAVAGPFDLPAAPKTTDAQTRAAWNGHLLNLRSISWREAKPLLMLNVTPPVKYPPENLPDAIIAAAEVLRGQEWFLGLALPVPPVAVDDAVAKAWMGK